MTGAPAAALLESVIGLVRDASDEVLGVYGRPFDVETKDDGSPLTEADLRAHRVLVAGLAPLLPGVPVISEESPATSQTGAASDRFWLVDPLDGTKEFVRRTDEFTVNVALIDSSRPVLGVVSAPALGRLWAGIVGGVVFTMDPDGARHAIGVRRAVDGIVVVGSRSHGNPSLMERFLEGRDVREFVGVGSSLKFCRIAEGRADLYPRFGRTMEWDTAAGHAILLAAGGRVETLEGEPLGYGKPGLENPHFVARA